MLVKRLEQINGHDFCTMMALASEHLREHAEYVNALNVFPVQDGDTGSNMSHTLTLGAEAMMHQSTGHVGTCAGYLARGLLMGARGNSGVIVSQLFRGFSKFASDHEELKAEAFMLALEQGVEMAYQSVVKPKEGTILTVAKEAVHSALHAARRSGNLNTAMEALVEQAKQTLARTPDMLPILKQAGVVDAGGQGLVYIYEGFLKALSGAQPNNVHQSATQQTRPQPSTAQPSEEAPLLPELHWAQEGFHTEDIERGYCTELIIQLKNEQKSTFEESTFRQALEKYGDSLLVVSDEAHIKIHIHAEAPGDVLNFAMQYGEVEGIKIENMRLQHSRIMTRRNHEADMRTIPSADTWESSMPKDFGIITVAAGQGIAAILKSLGADQVISGGPTMNPSTADFASAVDRLAARTIFIMPNNPNILLTAEHLKEVYPNRDIRVIGTRSIPQGIAALLAFNSLDTADANEQAMSDARTRVRSGEITKAVRDTKIEQFTIRQGNYLGLLDDKLCAVQEELMDALRILLKQMIQADSAMVTVLCGDTVTKQQDEALRSYIEEHYPQVELDMHPGGQPLYDYLISVE